jgi:zinc protease
VNGALLPTEEPFLYTVSVTVTDGTPVDELGDVLIEELDRVRRESITEAEIVRAKAQLKARLVFDNESITDIAHQLGYFETIASVDGFLDLPPRIAAVTLDDVSRVARSVLRPSNRTVGSFEPSNVDA